ncbi:MAG: cytochrome c biogenesis heme-transporting ATPase CcmA, partial [Rhodoferax sp.]
MPNSLSGPVVKFCEPAVGLGACPKIGVLFYSRLTLKTAPTLTFSKLGCSRGGRQLFQGVDCVLKAGHWLYVAGANGVGKTSLLRMVCGLAPIESGQILWNDTPIHSQSDVYRQDLCYLGHLNALQESMTVNENLVFTAALAGNAPEPTQLQEVLAHFGVRGRGEQLVKHLSQGQKRRVALSRLALSQARLWVLDEPFVAMDEKGVRMLADLIASHLGKGGLAVITSHQQV